MKLRNKKSGNIVVLSGITCEGNTTYIRFDDEKGNFMFAVCSLAELNSEWEDVPEEPEKYWYIEEDGDVIEMVYLEDDKFDQKRRQIGNYFETKEEAEKAVEKLKAWKRLKDKGFRFEGWDNTDLSTIHNFSLFVAIEDLESINKDLDLLFGGEE